MIAIIKYNAGNVKSVQNALDRLGYESVITNDKDTIEKADKVIFPGVGEAKSAMKSLVENDLDLLIPTLTQPVLGICLGQQLMCNFSEEGNTKCLGIFDAEVKRFPNDGIIPHMGWNDFTIQNDTLFSGINQSSDVYFVHSYYVEMNAFTAASTDYIIPFSAAIQKNNFYATQFHPEKSSSIGAKILQNFLEL
jgi:glutamine amidotransferase